MKSSLRIMGVVFLSILLAVSLTACGGGNGGDGNGGNGGDGAATYTASGTYTYDLGTGILTLNTTSSDFECEGPEVGTEEIPVISITSTTMIWDFGDGEQMTWTRDSGTSGDIVGTWESSDNETGNSWEGTFESNSSFSMTGQIVQCENGFNGNGAVLTHLPVDSGNVLWMQPFGNVDHGGGNAFFHPGIDFGTQTDGAFFSSASGNVTQVDLDTGAGSSGTNYRITIQVATNVSLDYHFEIFGDVPELQRRNNIFVAVGDQVAAGQHIGNLIVVNPDLSHVHWMIIENGEAVNCPLDYFSDDAAQSFETLYDSGIEKRPSSRPDLCE